MYDAAGGKLSAPGATTRSPVTRRAPLGWRNIAPLTGSRASISFSLSRAAECDEMESETAFGISFGVIISIEVPLSIQSAETFQVAKGNFSGVEGERSKTIPIGE